MRVENSFLSCKKPRGKADNYCQRLCDSVTENYFLIAQDGVKKLYVKEKYIERSSIVSRVLQFHASIILIICISKQERRKEFTTLQEVWTTVIQVMFMYQLMEAGVGRGRITVCV